VAPGGAASAVRSIEVVTPAVKSAFDRYCVNVRRIRAVPSVDPEPALYPALHELLGELVAAAGRPNATVASQAQTEVGKPDFVVDEGGPTGYVEAKRPDQPLSKLSGHDRQQRERFRDLPNWILTNYEVFELYVAGERVERAEIRPSSALDPESDNGEVLSDSADDVFRLFERFAAHDLPAPKTTRELAERLARAARILRDAVRQALERDEESAVAQLMDDWRESLFAEVDAASFADAYAQTLAYGLLTARMESTRPLSVEHAENTLQATHPFLAAALRFLSDPQVEGEIGWAARLLVRVLEPVGPEVFKASQSQPEPLLYFYEDFLARYDPRLRESRGVYYTPAPVVQFQVRAIQELLSDRLGKQLGFADKGVEVLDPAAGTGTYLLAAMDAGAERCREQQGQVSGGHVKRMLEQMHGFELLVGPYTVAHQRLAVRSAELAGQLLPPAEVEVYLTDTLAPSHAEETRERVPLALRPLTREREAADRVKDEAPILVVLGNPPYDRSKAASGEWIERSLMGAFKDPVPAEDRVHLKSLADPYVYFYRWALWKLFEHDREPGPRVLSFISNSSYLGGEAFQGMRKVLRERFDEIWILDLGGEQRGANPTENVFDIRVGVAVAICFASGVPTGEPATVRYAKFEGTRKEKYEQLAAGSLGGIAWSEVERSPLEPLLPVPGALFESLPALSEVMPASFSGIETKADGLLVSPRASYLESSIRRFLSSSPEQRSDLFRDASRRTAQSRSTTFRPEYMRSTAYRPLDYGWTYLDPNLVARPRPRLQKTWHSGQRYFSTLTRGHGPGPALFLHAAPPDRHSYRGSFGGHVYPFDLGPGLAESPNLAADVLPTLSRRLELEVRPGEAIAYIYAVLFAPGYQRRFAEGLAQSLPRVPFTTDPALFDEGAALGRKLIQLHSLSMPPVGEQKISGMLGPIVRPRWEGSSLHISDEGWLMPVSEEAWTFSVSGYRVLERWLRRREGIDLSTDPDLLEELLQVVDVLERTVRLVPQLDELLDRVLAGELIDRADLAREPWRRDAERLAADPDEMRRMSEDAVAMEELSLEAFARSDAE